MIKIMGALFVMLGCVGYAKTLLGQIARHRDILRSLGELTQLLAGHIRYEQVPVADALGQIKYKMHPQLAAVLERIEAKLYAGDCADLQKLWREEFQCSAAKLLLSPEELSEAQDIGKNLGCLDTTAQERHLEGCRVRLSKSLDKVQRELDEKKRLYRYLSLAAGVFVILILV